MKDGMSQREKNSLLPLVYEGASFMVSSLNVYHNLQYPERNLMARDWQLDGRRSCQAHIDRRFFTTKPVSVHIMR